MEMTFQTHLEHAGLTKYESQLYETLVRGGPLPASKAALNAGVPRTLAYKVLEDLAEKSLVERNDPKGAVSLFTAAHPLKLQELATQKKKEGERALVALERAVPELTSAYNLATGKPGIEFFEGEEGARDVLEDSLTSTEAIYTYADIETVDGYAGDINEAYVQKRIKKKVPKKILVPDTPAARAELRTLPESELTQMRLIPECDAPPFHAAMEIYDGKISYLTFTQTHMTGTIIHDRAIYEVHRFLFEHQWEHALIAADVARAQ